MVVLWQPRERHRSPVWNLAIACPFLPFLCLNLFSQRPLSTLGPQREVGCLDPFSFLPTPTPLLKNSFNIFTRFANEQKRLIAVFVNNFLCHTCSVKGGKGNTPKKINQLRTREEKSHVASSFSISTVCRIHLYRSMCGAHCPFQTELTFRVTDFFHLSSCGDVTFPASAAQTANRFLEQLLHLTLAMKTFGELLPSGQKEK